MNNLLRASTVLLFALAAAACDDSSDPAADAPAGNEAAGSGAPSGSTDQPSRGDEASGGDAAFGTLAACAIAEPCEASLAQLIENSSHNINEERARCVLQGLRDRTPGRYRHNTDHTFSNGSVGVHHVLIVSASGAVRYARDEYSVVEEVDPPAQRCRLADASYFASCLAALDGDGAGDADAAWACLFGTGSTVEPTELGWFASCADEPAPRCE